MPGKSKTAIPTWDCPNCTQPMPTSIRGCYVCGYAKPRRPPGATWTDPGAAEGSPLAPQESRRVQEPPSIQFSLVLLVMLLLVAWGCMYAIGQEVEPQDRAVAHVNAAEAR